MTAACVGRGCMQEAVAERGEEAVAVQWPLGLVRGGGGGRGGGEGYGRSGGGRSAYLTPLLPPTWHTTRHPCCLWC